MFFSQTFDLRDLFVIFVLIVLEGVLSIDNALVLGLLVRKLPENLRKRALSYGLIGALFFRIIAVLLAGMLLRWHIVQLIGGGYLVYVAVKHLLKKEQLERKEARGEEAPVEAPAKFWPTVLAVELTDIAFAIDSILAAIALVADEAAPAKGKLHPKLWVVVTGGMIGVVLIRAAAAVFIKILDKFPRFETAAYLLVFTIGDKLVADWSFNDADSPPRLDFSKPSRPEFWVFWGVMALCFCVGFLPVKKKKQPRSGDRS